MRLLPLALPLALEVEATGVEVAAAAVEVEEVAALPDSFLALAAAADLRVIPFAFMAALDFSVQGWGQVGVVWPTSLQLKHLVLLRSALSFE